MRELQVKQQRAVVLKACETALRTSGGNVLQRSRQRRSSPKRLETVKIRQV